ncbi:serine/threonine-protein kinase [Pseudonocardia asaccharolytica]|uniref:Protein kinase domain-containing protein n=1 Tax=Pseudonocardia asaccharolytica DSM 44247 = NBRC 16224 TaxID=1123024 RepID=A0A511D890_9PSEU|nr:serine/threonine-protein kinase [Pseudonocardia asaccharolytica]GEL21019.1 hypothetical protein PA7_48560 [Pseudonocardia asaccharolytica DSM 44247 = NBRC 16224]
MAVQPLLAEDPREIGGFVLDGRLGAGGMGVVYRGWSASGQVAAVKLVRAEFADDAEFRTRFRREIRAARAVGGTCTAKLLAADPDAERPWLATEYVEGPTLGEVVAASGPLAPEPLRALAAGLAEALAAVHAAGVVHRDLKPGNVLLGATGPRVIDFGIAAVAAATSATRTGMVVGSPGYMSPEQITGTGRVGPASDVFSWGLTVAFAATGRPPYGAADRFEVLLYRVVHSEPDVAGLPAAVAGPVLTALAKQPERRPTAEGLLRMLLPGAADPYAAATVMLREMWPGVPPLRRTEPRSRRTRTVLAVAGTALVLAAAGTGGHLLRGDDPGEGAALPTITDPTPAPTTVASTAPAPAPTTAPAPTRSTPDVAGFAGPIDAVGDRTRFSEFVYAHDGELIHLDITQQDGHASLDPDGSGYFAVEDDCAEPPCGGVQYAVRDPGPRTDSVFSTDEGYLVVRGHFAVTAHPGMQMGYLSVGLRAVPASEVS